MKGKTIILLVSIALLICTLSGCVEESKVNIAPVAGFTFIPERIHVNEPVKFVSTSTDANGDDLTFIWDFGDKSNLGLDENPTHIYAKEGKYTVTLTVSDGNDSNTSSQEIKVAAEIPSNLKPTANFTYSTTNLKAEFTDTSVDDDGNIMTWTWDFGDGNSSDEQNPAHTYAAVGTYNVTLMVTDDGGDSNIGDIVQVKYDQIVKPVIVTLEH